jgi:hypothetical protein
MSSRTTERVTIETATRGMRTPPEMHLQPGKHARGYVTVLLACSLGLMAVVAVFNALVDPFGTVGTGLLPTAIWSDRTVKVGLIGDLKTPPQLIVLGSSRAMKIQPRFLQRKTGLPGFNAAVSAGGPADAWAFVNLLHDRFPDAPPHYLWLFDVEALHPTTLDPALTRQPQLAPYFSASTRQEANIQGLTWLFSWDTFWTSWRSLRAHLSHKDQTQNKPQATRTTAAGKPRTVAQFAPDGFRRWDFHDALLAKGHTLVHELPGTIRDYSHTYRALYPHLDPTAEQYVEKTLALMNSLGATPVIVLSPYQPQVLAALRPLGWDTRHRQVLQFFQSMKARYRFVLLDMTQLASFHGSPTDFYDGVHMRLGNMHRFLTTVLAQSGSALR